MRIQCSRVQWNCCIQVCSTILLTWWRCFRSQNISFYNCRVVNVLYYCFTFIFVQCFLHRYRNDTDFLLFIRLALCNECWIWTMNTHTHTSYTDRLEEIAMKAMGSCFFYLLIFIVLSSCDSPLHCVDWLMYNRWHHRHHQRWRCR